MVFFRIIITTILLKRIYFKPYILEITIADIATPLIKSINQTAQVKNKNDKERNIIVNCKNLSIKNDGLEKYLSKGFYFQHITKDKGWREIFIKKCQAEILKSSAAILNGFNSRRIYTTSLILFENALFTVFHDSN
ncbi:hypothetical protein V1478_013514 [Vespula squamosa]|uniref:Uncharacterized protein n=1 Tax=Vespula squamosa TaxID=30214 RepID=A0ABD2A5D8_VESSQ